MKSRTEEKDLALAIAALNRSLVAGLMKRVETCGFKDMTPAFASIVPLLDESGARPTMLAKRAGISKQAVSQLVRELETRGYVEQIPDPSDTRAKIVRLTKRGTALTNACHKIKKEFVRAGTRALGKARIDRLHDDLMQLAEAIASI